MMQTVPVNRTTMPVPSWSFGGSYLSGCGSRLYCVVPDAQHHCNPPQRSITMPVLSAMCLSFLTLLLPFCTFCNGSQRLWKKDMQCLSFQGVLLSDFVLSDFLHFLQWVPAALEKGHAVPVLSLSSQGTACPLRELPVLSGSCQGVIGPIR